MSQRATEVDTKDGLGKAIALVIAGRKHELSEAMQRQVQRLQYVADEYGAGKNRRELIKDLIDQWGIGSAQAYVDYALAKKYFLNENLIEVRDVHVSILLDTALEAIEVERKKSSPDPRGLAALLKVYKESIKEFTGDKEAIDWSEVILPPIVMVFDPQLFDNKLSNSIEEFSKTKAKYEKQILNWNKKVLELPETPFEDVE